MDREQQRRLHRQAGRRHAVVSTVFVCLIALCISLFALQLPTLLAHAVFASCLTLFYVVLLRLCGRRNYDALIIMAILFVMLAFLSTTIRK
jgi:lipopolysaccharide export LptBFGC system permease protein LptF